MTHIVIKLDHPPFEVTRESIENLPDWADFFYDITIMSANIIGVGLVCWGHYLVSCRGKIEVWSPEDVERYIKPDPVIDLAAMIYAAEEVEFDHDEELEDWFQHCRKNILEGMAAAHFGDCTKQPQTCARCFAERYLSRAQAIRQLEKECGK